ncbi:MAG: MOSC domain-containing protein [Ktedonobacteraceae bacterium]|nr:MOSC domain-containing protein [Ktedonobacteraceae bacterium]
MIDENSIQTVQPVNTNKGTVVAVCRNEKPGLPKPVVDEVTLIEDWGIEGDYHAGKLVRHRYLAKKDPTQPNIRQVLLIDTTILAELKQEGIDISSGMLGDNITVEGLVVMSVPLGAQLTVGEALLEITEIRTPCSQLNQMDKRLLKASVIKEDGKKRFRAGIMARVLKGGRVRAGDQIIVC